LWDLLAKMEGVRQQGETNRKERLEQIGWRLRGLIDAIASGLAEDSRFNIRKC
jgi:hypothetical protein